MNKDLREIVESNFEGRADISPKTRKKLEAMRDRDETFRTMNSFMRNLTSPFFGKAPSFSR
ncbi:hypothetical protein ACKC9G_06480 [Pokkaliibacter sp. CJK22405]|uniref:hypothetical protein n=1 Tax=Pokkaliibacter sp. CJK22405 TaxID=3384615 RepID=UPI0039855D64